MEEQIRILKIEPGKEPEDTRIDNTLEAMQAAVGGYIQAVPLEPGAYIVCNEEGKLMGLEANRCFGTDILVGTFFIVGDNGGEDFCSLTVEQMEKYTQQFKGPVTQQTEDFHFGYLSM